MIKWGAVKRKEDPYVFVELAVAEALKGRYKVWLFSDARRINDLLYFRRKYKQKCFSVRVICSEEERINRGYIFTEGVDDCESECGLDNINDWDFVFINDKEHDFQKQIEDLLLIIGKRIS